MKRTLQVIIGAAILASVGYAIAQQTAPSELPGCVYNATPPVLADKQTIVIQCDVNGKIKVGS